MFKDILFMQDEYPEAIDWSKVLGFSGIILLSVALLGLLPSLYPDNKEPIMMLVILGLTVYAFNKQIDNG